MNESVKTGIAVNGYVWLGYVHVNDLRTSMASSSMESAVLYTTRHK
jgi:hypothetical protein